MFRFWGLNMIASLDLTSNSVSVHAYISDLWLSKRHFQFNAIYAYISKF